ncbi:MAG: amidase family protein [Gemmatimonadetes bacterium]|nr:amidase family protein [Gemmatimonadota bacterium]MCY3678077.1 amidase family protein [Gemmatimonadota bacterium]MYE92479.1 glutamyl-tRNA amidotransferase [Gemmatimonadota bacterium]
MKSDTHRQAALLRRLFRRHSLALPDRTRCAARFAAGVSALAAVATACDRPDPAPIPIVEATIAAVQEAIFSGRTTCRMVVQAYLDRIDAYEDRINAITVVNPAALDRADELDAALAAGDEPGPLFCVPMLVKDNFDTHDMITTAGSIALAGSIPPDDAFMVRRIREAGAIVVAKTNMAEWAFSARQSVSSSFDTTRNAYALDRVPAGSSGGTASGVAANFGLIGLGSDTGNSIRGPSSRLALVGIRSTIGLTSRDGVVPLSFDRDIAGPMGRTVEDVARVFSVVAGYDPADPYTEAGRGRPEDDYTTFLDASGLQGARIGVLRALVDTEDADSAVVAVFEQSLTELAGLGAEIVDPFDFDVQAQLDREDMFCGRFRYDMHVYLGSLGDAAPITDVVQVLETGQYSEYVENSLRRAEDTPPDVHPADRDPPCPDYVENEGRQAYLADLVAAMDAAEVDALVYPSWLSPPAHIDRGREEYSGDNSQRVAPATGMPAITVPMGFTDDTHPAGLQILARPWAEGLLFRLAYAYEQGTRHRRPPPGFPELPSPAEDP